MDDRDQAEQPEPNEIHWSIQTSFPTYLQRNRLLAGPEQNAIDCAGALAIIALGFAGGPARLDMIDWNIQARSHACQACHRPFADKEPFHTLLFDERHGYQR